MKTRFFTLLSLSVLLLGLLVGLFPAGTVFADDSGNYKFYGTVESLPTTGWVGDWTVSGRTVHVSAATRIDQEHGAVAVGAYVEVKGWLQADNSVNAAKVEVKQSSGGGSGSYTKFYGTVESLPTAGLIGDWRVSGRTVHVTSATRINQEHGAVAVGAYVEVKGSSLADGSVSAAEIEVKQSPSGGGGNGGYTDFYGTIQTLPASGLIGDWQVNGRTVHVTTATRIKQERGPVAVGAYVEVKGSSLADGSVSAAEIEVKQSPGGGGSYVKFYGTVQSLPATGLIGDWVVSGRTVHVTATTPIEQKRGQVRVGSYVEVKGTQQSDGSVIASKIEVKR